MHCAAFLLSILLFVGFCKWVRMTIIQNREKETQLDRMIKSKIFASPAFKNSLRHYENNICVQYASEEEYMSMIKLKEQ